MRTPWRSSQTVTRLADAALAAVLLAVGESEVWLRWTDGTVGVTPHGHQPERALLIVVFTVPLVWRRSRPMTVLLTICAGLVVQLILVVPQAPFLAGLVPMVIANYSAAVYAAARVRVLSLLAVGAVELTAYLRVPSERAGGEVMFAVLAAVGTWVVGDVVRARSRHAQRAVDEARTRAVAREAAAAAALSDERARIARELHDVIAHGVSVMGVQAAAARMQLDADPEAARAALRGIESTARSSIAELQRLLAVLRGAGPDAGREPQPGMSRLPALVDQVRDAGLPVTLRLPTDLPALSPGVGLAAYRIVQEALTNALKYAHAPTTVTVSCAFGELVLEIRDCGPGRVNGQAGHGLAGMRERAELYGGTLTAGPDTSHGGFAVCARLPLSAESRP